MLRKILKMIKLKDFVSNARVLNISDVKYIQQILTAKHFERVGRVIRIDDSCILKRIFYGLPGAGKRNVGRRSSSGFEKRTINPKTYIDWERSNK